MTLNNSNQAIKDHRRRRVSHYRLRGLTQREIVEALAAEGTINTETGKPWALGTVNLDLKAIQADWQDEAKQDIMLHTGRILAELREIARTAWASDDLGVILRSLKQQAELLGVDAPLILDHNVNLPDIEGWKAQQADRQAEADDTLNLFDADEKG